MEEISASSVAKFERGVVVLFESLYHKNEGQDLKDLSIRAG